MNTPITSTFRGNRHIISKTVTDNYTFDDQTETVNADATGGPITVTLPLISLNIGRLITVRKVDASINAVTITRADSDLYQGATSVTLTTQWAALSMDNDGTQWYSGAAGIAGIDGNNYIRSGRTPGGCTHASPGSGFVAWGSLTVPTEYGSGTSGPVDDTDSQYTSYEMATAADSVAGHVYGDRASHFGVRPCITAKFKFPTSADFPEMRVWFGLFMTTLSTVDSDATTSYVALRSTSGETWKLCSSDGSTASEIDTGVAVVASGTGAGHTYELDFSSSSSLKFYYDGVLIATKTTNLPADSTSPTGFNPVLRVTRTSGSTLRNFRIAHVLFERN